MELVRGVVAVSLVVLAAACSPASARQAASVPPSQSPAAAASPSPSDSPATALLPPAQPIAVPSNLPVSFSGLPAGTYITHLHSACSGAQNFHVTVLQSLEIGADGTGSIAVPSSYFGRGLCVIVYANSSQSRVLTTRPI